jgi:gliding motility-associated-like protein
LLNKKSNIIFARVLMRKTKTILFLLLMVLSFKSLHSQCGSIYVEASDTAFCIPKVVNFKIHNYPPNTTFEWDLGSGYITALDAYTIMYSVSGYHDVRVRFTFQDGSKCVLFYEDFINARANPIPQFSANRLALCDISDSLIINDITPNSVKRDWLIGNNVYNNDSSTIVEKLSLPYGYKPMTMFVRDVFGCNGKKTFDSAFYLPKPLVVDFVANKISGCIPASINFINKSDTAGITVSQWKWEFPNANSSNLSNASYPQNIIYNSIDTFDVSLIGITNAGCTDTIIKQNYLMFGDSVSIGVSIPITSFCAGRVLEVSHTNIRNPSPQLTFNPTNYSILSSTPTMSRVKFSLNSSYSLNIKDVINGCVSEKNIPNAFQVVGPVANFSIDNDKSCIRPDTFKVTDESILSPGVTKQNRWDLFYDSLPNTTLQTATNTNKVGLIASQYAKYSIRLIIIGSDGCTDTLIRKTSFEIKPILPRFDWSPLVACPGETVEFNNTTEIVTKKVPNKYQWLFYDLDKSIMKTDTNKNPKVSYPSKGKYSVSLIAFNSLGCRDTLTKDTQIVVIDPTPTLIAEKTNLCKTEPFVIKITYKDSLAKTKYTYRWLFYHKDSINLIYLVNNLDSISVNYLNPGQYKVKVIRFSIPTFSCRDTFEFPSPIYVSGINMTPRASPNIGCQPFVSNLSSRQSFNYNFKNGNPNNVSVLWRTVLDTNQIVIRQPTLLNTQAFVKRRGNYNILMVSTHSSGCKDSVFTPRIDAGFSTWFTAVGRNGAACVDKPYQLINQSNPAFVSYKWMVLDSVSGFTISPSNTSKDISINFSKTGYYRIALIGYGSGACNDTVIQGVNVSSIKANFFSEDTISYCAPVIVRLSAKKNPNIISYKWFVDNKVLDNTNPNIGYLINRNTGPDGMPVKLVVNGYACNDTMEDASFFKVIGPIPQFRLENNTGCEKLNVKFINESKYFNKFFIEYGDGTALDSIKFKNHIYQIYDRALPLQVYRPKVSIVDTFGCLATFKRDTIIVFKAPEGNFSVDRDSGCAMLDVKFKNLSIGAVSYKWDFENAQKINSTQVGPTYQYAVGVFNPMLISKSANGCEDTTKNIVNIHSFENPRVNFISSQDTICYNTKVDFTSSIISIHSNIVSWSWDFGNYSITSDTSSKKNPSYTFVRPLLNLVSLQVEDNFGCKDTVEKYIYVYDTIGPESEPINYVSVTDNKDIVINWKASKFNRFNRYYLYNDNSGYTLIHSTNVRTDTTYKVTSGIDIAQSRYCYSIRTSDNCNSIGKPAFPHCTILVKISDSINKLVLSWLPYEGWGAAKVERYRIYRKEPNGQFILLDSTTNTNYSDDGLCPKLYCYYVVAVQKNGKWLSVSNTECKIPKYIPPTLPVDATRVTILDNGNPLIEWDKYTHVKRVKKYHISRFYEGASKDKFYATSDSLRFIDEGFNVFTNSNSYTYWVRAEDHCGTQSPESSESKTILLKGKSLNYLAKMEWTPYQKWYSGIKKYEILFKENGEFKIIGTVDKNSQTYEYNFLDTKMDDSLCFRIRAIKDTTIDIESLSNILCLISDPQMFVPSAFSPNGDGNNDVFIPKSILIFNNTGNPIKDYYMEVFNRWGEKVFESRDATIGWDGNYKGKKALDGVYLYRVRGLGLDGITTFNLDGVVTLLR